MAKHAAGVWGLWFQGMSLNCVPVHTNAGFVACLVDVSGSRAKPMKMVIRGIGQEQIKLNHLKKIEIAEETRNPTDSKTKKDR